MKKLLSTILLSNISLMIFGQSVTINPAFGADQQIMTYYGGFPTIIGRSAGGTSASPTASAANSTLFFLGARGWDGTSFNLSSTAILFNANQLFASGARGTNITFSTTADNSINRLERMRIGHNGNVGIGTTTPHAALQFGNIISNRRIVLWENADNDHEIYGFGINGGMLRYQVPGGAVHAFYAATSATASNELMRIMPDGKVGIGTAAPTSGLHINNDRGSLGTYNEYIYNTGPTNYAGLGLYYTGGGVVLFGAANNLQVANNAGGFSSVSASAFNVASDIRVKKEIVNLGFENNEEYLSQIRKIQSATYRYNWEDATSRATPHIGFIAQTLPDAVTTSMDKTPGTSSEKILGYNLSDMAGLTLMGLKAVDAEMQELKATIKALQAEIELLKKK